MMSIAAAKALWQLVITPSFWEKTTHGLYPESPNNDAGGEQESPDLRLVS
jgi:glycosyltransferase XagB